MPQTSLVAADKVIEQLQNVAYWHLATLRRSSSDIRSREQSGRSGHRFNR